MRAAALGAVAIVAMVAAAACGGGGGSSKQYTGAGAAAVAQFFEQEAAGGRLPEGQDVSGVGSQQIKTLAVTSDQKKQSVKARVCVEYRYTLRQPPFTARTRVYIATLQSGAWNVEAVKPDGTCDDVA